MTRVRKLPGLAVLLASGLATAQVDSIPIGKNAACMEGPLAEFGQYVGDWDIADSTLDQDGATWTEGAGAKWNFVCLARVQPYRISGCPMAVR